MKGNLRGYFDPKHSPANLHQELQAVCHQLPNQKICQNLYPLSPVHPIAQGAGLLPLAVYQRRQVSHERIREFHLDLYRGELIWWASHPATKLLPEPQLLARRGKAGCWLSYRLPSLGNARRLGSILTYCWAALRTASTATATSAPSVVQLLTEIRSTFLPCQCDPEIQTVES